MPGLLTFHHGLMGSGKSTMCLGLFHSITRSGGCAVLVTAGDRSGGGEISTRLGSRQPAVIISDGEDPVEMCLSQVRPGSLSGGTVLCDEAQFLAPVQVDRLRMLVDEVEADVHLFGLLTDFRTKLFPGSARIVEVADEVWRVPSRVLCWCGEVAHFHARVVDGVVVRTGPDRVIGDVRSPQSRTSYAVLCSRHHGSGLLG